MNKKDFPLILESGKTYLNSAATSQKPKVVIEALKEFYEKYNANINRGSDSLTQEADKIYLEAKQKIADFINADVEEIIFTKSCTEAINLVSRGIDFKEGDKIVTSILEHHSNFVPWKILEKEKKVNVEVLDCDDSGRIVIDGEDGPQHRPSTNSRPRSDEPNSGFAKPLAHPSDQKNVFNGVRLVAISGMSNVFGTVQDVKKICEVAKRNSSLVLIDAAQLVVHEKIDVKDLNCDFLCFSGHKMLGVNGIGVLYMKKEIQKSVKPLLYGGDMIKSVGLKEISFKDNYEKFEGGTQDVAAAYALGKAIDYLRQFEKGEIEDHINELTKYCIEGLEKFGEIKVYGQNQKGIISFNLGKVHCHDVAEILGNEKVVVRAGHMCCQPLMEKLEVSGVVRASIQVYNSKEDIDNLIFGLIKCRKVFAVKNSVLKADVTKVASEV